MSLGGKVFVIICGFSVSYGLQAEHAHCPKEQVVLRHFGGESQVCETEPSDLDFKPWYHRHEYYDADEQEHADPTGKLQDDSAWPGEREEYSDYLLRDLNEKE
jgi:hypothetical protein